MTKYVLDTNLFFNMEPGLGMGKKTEDVVVAVTQGIKKQKKDQKNEFYMPPRIVDEFLSFFDDKEQPFIKAFLGEVIVKAPDISQVEFPASIFYQLVHDVRERSYRGLTVASEEVEHAARSMVGTAELNKKDFEMKVGPVVKALRQRYRQATRTGFLDSLADLDLIVLSKEQNATLISSDEGVITWARAFGVKEMLPQAFGPLLQA